MLRVGGRVTTNWSGRGAIAGCHCSVLWWGEGSSVKWLAGEGDDQLWGRGAIAGCHRGVPL